MGTKLLKLKNMVDEKVILPMEEFFWEGELKKERVGVVNAKIEKNRAAIEATEEKKAAKKAAKAAEKAAEKALLEEEEQRQREAAEKGLAMFGDIAEKNNVEVDYDVVPEERTSKLSSIVEKFKKSETNVVEKYIKSDVSALLDENLKSFQNSPSGQSLLNRNLSTSPLYIADGKDKLCIERIYKVESNIEDVANLVVETKYCKFLMEFKVSIKF